MLHTSDKVVAFFAVFIKKNSYGVSTAFLRFLQIPLTLNLLNLIFNPPDRLLCYVSLAQHANVTCGLDKQTPAVYVFPLHILNHSSHKDHTLKRVFRIKLFWVLLRFGLWYLWVQLRLNVFLVDRHNRKQEEGRNGRNAKNREEETWRRNKQWLI